MFLMFVGRLFHSRGPATEKARSPNLVRVVDDCIAFSRKTYLLLETCNQLHYLIKNYVFNNFQKTV